MQRTFHLNKRTEDPTAIRGRRRQVYDGRASVGAVYPSESGWLAEDSDGRIIGSFHKEQAAVHALLDARTRR
jgi:hypothetical protein